MKKMFKNIGVTLLIVLFTAICLSFIGVAYLFLYPKGELFGVIYLSDKSLEVYSVGEYDISQLNKIELKTNNFDIIVDTDNTDTVRAYVKTRVVGLCLKKNSESKFEYLYNENESKLTLNMREATGWLSAKDSYVKLVVPKKLMESGFDLELSTKNKTDININGRGVTKLNNLDVVINRGDFYFDNLEVENLFVKANKGTVIAGVNVVGNTNYVSLDINNSYVDLLKAGDKNGYIDNGIPNIDQIDYKINNLVIKSASRKSDIRIFNCGYMYTAPSCSASGGSIIVYYLGKAKVDADNCEIQIYQLLDNDDSKFTFDGEGGLNIIENYSVLDATTNSGEIYVKMSDNVMSLETTSGSVNVQKARKPISLITFRGKANISFDKDSEDGSYTVEREIISLRTCYGNIKLYGVDKVSGIVDTEGAPNIEIHYNQVNGTSTIDAKKANLKIVVPQDKPLTMDLVCTNAKLNIHVGTVTNEGTCNGDFTRTVYAGATTNILNITTAGYVNIMSKDIYELKK